MVGAFVQLVWAIAPLLLRIPLLTALWLSVALTMPWQSLADRRADDSELYTRDFLEFVDETFPQFLPGFLLLLV